MTRPYRGRHEAAPVPMTSPHEAVQAAANERIRVAIPHTPKHERRQP